MRQFAIVIVAVALAACSSEDALIREAREAVREQLVDPESANFRDEDLVFTKEGYVCLGEVNAKNRMGGYTGFKPYVYSREFGAATMEGDLDLMMKIQDECSRLQDLELSQE